MKRRRPFLFPLLSGFLFCLLCAACAAEPAMPPAAEETALTPVDNSAYYSRQSLPLPGELLRASAISYDPLTARIFYLALEQEGSMLYALDPATGEASALPGYRQLSPQDLPADAACSMDCFGLAPDGAGGLWLGARFTILAEEGAAASLPETSWALCRLDESGALCEMLPLAAEEAPASAQGNQLAAAGGLLFLQQSSKQLQAMDATGAELFSLQTSGNIRQLLPLTDGSAAVLLQGSGGALFLQYIDAAAEDWGARYLLPQGAERLFTGAAGTALFSGSGSLFACDTAAGTASQLLNWANCDLQPGAVLFLLQQEDGGLLCLQQRDVTSGASLLQLARTASKTPPGKTVLRLGGLLAVSGIREAVLAFNANDSLYQVELVEYTDQAADMHAAILLLHTDIILGQGPDLLLTDLLPLRHYVSAGLLLDLYPFLDAEDGLGREDILPELRAAWEHAGGLYHISPDFSIFTLAGPASVWQGLDFNRSNFQRVWQEYAELRQPVANLTASGMLSALLQLELPLYLDWQNGSCSFESQDFIELLQFCARFPLEIDWQSPDYLEDEDMVAAGRSLLARVSVSDYGSPQLLQALWGAPVTYTGLPLAEAGGNYFHSNNMVAISSQSAHPEGCWRFIRFLLSEEYQLEHAGSFASNREVFAQKQAEAMQMEVEADGTVKPRLRYGTVSSSGKSVNIYTATSEEVAQVMALLHSTTQMAEYDQRIMDIVNEEAAAFFAGQNSAAQAAAIIQSRVSIYVNEQL